MSQADFLTLIASKVQDTAGKLTPLNMLEALKTAVDEYSTVRPRHRIATVVGDGIAVTYDLPLDYEEGFSQITSIEHPVGRQYPEYLDQDGYMLYRDPVTNQLQLRFLSMTPSAATSVYVDYTTRHHVLSAAPVADVADTVPLTHRDAVASLAGAHCAMRLAFYYAQTSEPTIGADTVDYGTKSADYLALAKDLRSVYSITFGTVDGVPAASAIVDLDVNMQGGWDRFWHPRGDR